MAQELTDEEVFGELSDAQVFGGQQAAKPKPPSWQDTLARGLSQSGGFGGIGGNWMVNVTAPHGTPEFYAQVDEAWKAHREGLAMSARMSAPLAAPGAGLVANAALSGASELGAQLTGGEELNPREIAARTLQGAIPFVNKFGAIGRTALNAALQGGGATAADLIAKGKVNPINSAIGASLGGAGGLVSSVAAPIARGVGEFANATQEGASFGSALRRGVAEAFRPTELTAEQIAVQRARHELNTDLQRAGGPVPPIPIGLSEAIRTPQLVREMSIPGAEVSPESMRNISELSAFVASNLSRSGRGPNEVAREVQQILTQEIGNINKPTEDAIKQFSAQMSRSVNRAENNAIDAADRYFPSLGKSRADLGSEGSELVNDTLESARKEWNAKYAALESNPDYANVSVDLAPVANRAKELGMGLISDAEGNLIPVANPKGTVATVQSASELPDKINLDQARKLSSEMHRVIRNANILPGVDTRFRVDLFDKLQSQIDKSLEPFPGLHSELRDTNAGYKDAMGRYKTSFGEGVLADAQNKEGMLPETIFQKLTGANAESYLDDFERLAGRDAKFGTDNSERARALVREMILSLGAEKARPSTGEVNFGAAYKLVNDLPKGVRNKLFPDFDEMGAAFMREAAAGGAKKLVKDPEKYLSQYRVNAKELNEALGSRDAKRLNALAKSVVEKQKLANAELNAMSLDQIAQQNEFKIHDYIIDPVNTGKVKGVIGLIEKNNPELASDVKSLFLDDMLNRATKAGKFDPEAFLSSIAEPYSSRAGSAGSQGGAYLENAEAVLGRDAVRAIRGNMEKLKLLPEPKVVSEKQQRGFLNWLLLGAEGTSLFSRTGPQALGVRLQHLSPIIRYKMAARFLSDDSLRARALQPTGTGLERAINRVLGIVTQDLARQYGPNSPIVQEAQGAVGER